jgi:HPt (histidine-containing phosphotransfer) domain-containing protein
MAVNARGPEDQIPAGVFDVEAALARLGNDQSLFEEMIEFFFADSPGLLRQIREGVERNDAKQVERSAHSLKGMASMFDAGRTVASAAAIEEIARSRQLERVPPLAEQLDAEVQHLFRAMGPLRAKR